MDITLTLVPEGFHKRDFSEGEISKGHHILHVDQRTCVHMHLGKPCGKVINTPRPNGWLCGFHDSIVFKSPTKATEAA